MKCPVCKVPMFGVEHLKVEIDLCPECRGVWFDRGELELLLGSEKAVDTVAAETPERIRRCPLCPCKMDKVNIGPGRKVLIDACPDGCGLWFDDHEIADLTDDLHSGGWRVHEDVRAYLCGLFPQ